MVIKTPVCIFKFEKSPIGKVPKLEWYPYVLLFPDLLCKTVKVSSGDAKYISTTRYTPSNFHKKISSSFPGLCVYSLLSFFL